MRCFKLSASPRGSGPPVGRAPKIKVNVQLDCGLSSTVSSCTCTYFMLPIRGISRSNQAAITYLIAGSSSLILPQESEERGQNADDEDDAVRGIRQIDCQLGDLKERDMCEGRNSFPVCTMCGWHLNLLRVYFGTCRL